MIVNRLVNHNGCERDANTSILWQFLTLPTAIFIGYLLISSILSNWDTYAAKKYLEGMVDKFGPSYTPKDWLRLKQETRMRWIALHVVVAVAYVVYVAIRLGLR